MRKLVPSMALAAALTVPMMADDWQRGPYDDRGYGRDRYEDRDYRNGRYGRGDAGWGAISRVEQDLRSVGSRGWYGDSRERRSIDKALNDLERARDRWQRNGRMDQGRIDSASRHISDALRDGRMDGRDRAVLSRDLNLLQQLRNGGYGNYGYGGYGNGGYGPWGR